MPDLTHAVFDALTGERVSYPMTTDEAFMVCSFCRAKRGQRAGGD